MWLPTASASNAEKEGIQKARVECVLFDNGFLIMTAQIAAERKFNRWKPPASAWLCATLATIVLTSFQLWSQWPKRTAIVFCDEIWSGNLSEAGQLMIDPGDGINCERLSEF